MFILMHEWKPALKEAKAQVKGRTSHEKNLIAIRVDPTG